MGQQHISVVIAAYNEQQQISLTLQGLSSENVHEIIVAVGQSTDTTAQMAEACGATVVHGPTGRGTQMNQGAAIASGDVLLFLHADTRLPQNFTEHVMRAIAIDGVVAGAFRLAIDAPDRSFRFIEVIVNWRSVHSHMPYGDQAIFLTSPMFNRVGGFRNWPIMEDYEFIRRLRHMGRIEIVDTVAMTSARRWLSRGIWRTTLLNRLCITAYQFGVSPQRIASWRQHLVAIKGEEACEPSPAVKQLGT